MSDGRGGHGRRSFLAAMAAGTAGFAGCTAPNIVRQETEAVDHSPQPGTEQWQPAPGSPLAVDVEPDILVENLEIPWDIAFAPNDEMFVTERVGRVTRFDGERVRTVVEPDDAVDAGSIEPGSDERPWWVDGGEGGTLGVAVHPGYPDPSWVYVYYTTEGDDPNNRVVRFDPTADDPGATEEVLVDDIPANLFHNGGRLRFGPRNYLWVTTGDAGEPKKSRDPGTLNGKILRITPDGEPAPENPDHGGDPRVFTHGHRNPQGIVWLPDNTPVCTEHGPSGRDEVNRLMAGDNYGWPTARRPDQYRSHPEFHRPLLNTGDGPSWAPTGAVVHTGDGIEAWHNRLVFGGLISQSVWVVTLTPPGGDPPPADDGRRFDDDWFDDAYHVTAHRALEDVLGRVRLVTQGPDGDLFAITSNRDGRAKGEFPRERDDVLVRLTAG